MPVVDEHDSVADEDLVLDPDALADEGVALQLAAPADLHYAAMRLQVQPESDISITKVECDPQDYKSGIPKDATT